MQNLTGWHALLILAVVVLIFGAAKLPALAKSVGQSVRILKKEAADDTTIATTSSTATEPETTVLHAVPATGVIHEERAGS
ncbi:MAG: twin-arginine translocase TatA/TatE family subunit [Microbacterium sp.]